GQSDEQLFAFMGRGAAATDQQAQARTHDPVGFWTLDPKAAALALVEVNRSKKHRSQVELAVDDQDGKGPGGAGFIRLTDESSRCYIARDNHFLLRCDPQ